MNLLNRIFRWKRKSDPAKDNGTIQARLAAATAQQDLAQHIAAAMHDLLNTVDRQKIQPGPAGKSAPEYHVLSLTAEERQALMRAAAKGMYYNIPCIETRELAQAERDTALDILFRMKATVGSQQEISQEGKLVEVKTVLL